MRHELNESIFVLYLVIVVYYWLKLINVDLIIFGTLIGLSFEKETTGNSEMVYHNNISLTSHLFLRVFWQGLKTISSAGNSHNSSPIHYELN